MKKRKLRKQAKAALMQMLKAAEEYLKAEELLQKQGQASAKASSASRQLPREKGRRADHA